LQKIMDKIMDKFGGDLPKFLKPKKDTKDWLPPSSDDTPTRWGERPVSGVTGLQDAPVKPMAPAKPATAPIIGAKPAAPAKPPENPVSKHLGKAATSFGRAAEAHTQAAGVHQIAARQFSGLHGNIVTAKPPAPRPAATAAPTPKPTSSIVTAQAPSKIALARRRLSEAAGTATSPRFQQGGGHDALPSGVPGMKPEGLESEFGTGISGLEGLESKLRGSGEKEDKMKPLARMERLLGQVFGDKWRAAVARDTIARFKDAWGPEAQQASTAARSAQSNYAKSKNAMMKHPVGSPQHTAATAKFHQAGEQRYEAHKNFANVGGSRAHAALRSMGGSHDEMPSMGSSASVTPSPAPASSMPSTPMSDARRTLDRFLKQRRAA
jgi:hypothetical protein